MGGRGEATCYDRKLDEVFGKVGAGEIRDVILDKVFDAISEAHPELGLACLERRSRQYADRLAGDDVRDGYDSPVTSAAGYDVVGAAAFARSLQDASQGR